MKTIEQLQEENAALQAQVEALRRAYEASKFTEFGDKILENAFAATPQQHLAEIRAEAGRAGFVAGYLLCNDGSPLIKHNFCRQIRRQHPAGRGVVMLSRWNLLKVIIKSHFHYLCGSREVVGKDSNKISDESFIFESNGTYYLVSLGVTKEPKAAKRQGGAE